jgi:hypothetical protein
MGRSFTKNLSNYCSLGNNAIGSLLAGAPAISYHTWMYWRSGTETTNQRHALINIIGNAGTASFSVWPNGTNVRINMLSRSVNTDGANVLLGTAGEIRLNEWFSIGGIASFQNSRCKTFINGNPSINTSAAYANAYYTQGNATSADRIGASGTGDTALQFDGIIAHTALWRCELTHADYKDLAAGLDPKSLYPESLVAYFPMQDPNGIDNVVAETPGTITGSIPITEDPPQSLWTPDELLRPNMNVAKFVATLEAA